MLTKEKLLNKFGKKFCKSYGPEIIIDLLVKKYSDVSKVNCAKSLLFFPPLKVLKLDLINSQTASNVSKLDLSLDPRSFQESRIENQVSSIEL